MDKPNEKMLHPDGRGVKKRIGSWRIFLPALLLSLLFLGVCSKSSPLYPLNDWVDVNCFFTMGRGALHGKVMYRDLYEQKGPVLYFIYALAALISETSYIGVFLFEVLLFALFLYAAGRLASLYLKSTLAVGLVMTVSAWAVTMSYAFSHGCSVEEMNLGFMLYALYQLFRTAEKKEGVPVIGAAVIGCGAAIAFWSKYTICGFYLGIVLAVPFLYLTLKLPFRKFLEAVFGFLAGFGLVTLPVVIYFWANHAMKDLFEVYFYNNIFLYPKETEGSRLSLIWSCFKNMAYWNRKGFMCGVWACGGWLILRSWKRWRELVIALLALAGLTATTYYGGRGYDYYGLVFACFAAPGFAGVLELLRRAMQLIRRLWGLRAEKHPPMGILRIVSCTLLVIFTAFLLWQAAEDSKNVYLTKIPKEETPQYIFAETISSVENASLMNYGFLDGGFYFAAGVIPDCRYFCSFNITGTDMKSVQKEYIDSGTPDFIVTRKYQLQQYGLGNNLYRQVDSATMYFSGTDYTYYLYERKDLLP